MERTLTCCFTGHRILPKEKLDAIEKRLSEVIDGLIRQNCTRFLCGGAVGFDLFAAELVIQKKRTVPQLELVMVLPCKDQHKNWNTEDKRRYQSILGKAGEVFYVCEEYCTGCMHLRNKQMVKQSDVCVAYFTRGGGTGHTVDCAREKGIEVINIAHML